MRQSFGPTLSILVVEDDAAVAELMRSVLNRMPGWGTTVVQDASAAKEIIRHVQMELVVLDVNLPGISGPELLAMLQEDPAWQHPPVILVSSDVEQPGVQEAVRAGWAVAALQKPFDIDDLIAHIERTTSDDAKPTCSA